MSKTEEEPKGVIAIWTDPHGSVMATKADFNRSGYGGFKLWEAQRLRARKFVQWDAVKAYCSPVVTDCLTEYLIEEIAQEMQRKGHKVTIRALGYDGPTKDEIERY